MTSSLMCIIISMICMAIAFFANNLNLLVMCGFIMLNCTLMYLAIVEKNDK